MKTKSSLFLTELIIIIFFFFISVAVCLRLFATAHIYDRKSVELNHAVVFAQNISEIFYSANDNELDMITRYLFNDDNSIALIRDDHSFSFYLNENFIPINASSGPYKCITSVDYDTDFVYLNLRFESHINPKSYYCVYEASTKKNIKEVRIHEE